MSQSPIVIAAARRTPIGAFQGALAPVSAPDLGATAAAAAIEDCGVKPEDIDTQSLDLTPAIQAKVNPVIDMVLAELKRFGGTCWEKAAG